MNQILVDDSDDNYGNNSQKRRSIPKGYGGSQEPMDIDTVLKIFVVITIVFGVLLIAKGAYALSNNSSNTVTTVTNKNIAQILMTQTTSEEGDKINISINSQTPIDKVVYKWNDNGTERTLKGNGQTQFEQLIDAPKGRNTLYIQVIDTSGEEQEQNQEFTTENGIDINNPVIELSVTEDKRLKITATDESSLAYITYRWNQDEEQKITTEDENQLKIETTIDILKGENTITVVAVDNTGNPTTETKKFIGLNAPEIAVNLSDDGSKLIIKVTHENGLKNIYYTLNDKPYEANLDDKTIYQENPKVFEFQQALDQGYNRIIMKVTSVEGTTKDFDGQCEYNP